MLTRFHKVLIAILALQIVLVAVVMTRSDEGAAQKEHVLVADFDAAKVTRLQVFAKPEAKADAKADGKSDAKPIDLVKRDASWVVASAFDYPVDAAKIKEVLEPIGKLTAAAPIATQASRYKQLHVADDDFERKLVITRDGKDVTLYLGNSVGARRTAFRIAGQDGVWGATGISAFSFGTEPRQWVDPNYVKVPRDEVAKVTIARDAGGVEITRVASAPPPAAGSDAGSAAPPAQDHWVATLRGGPITLAAGESIDDAAIERLLGDATSLELSAPADAKRDASKPTATITIEKKAAGASPTVIDIVADGASYWVHDKSQQRAVLVDKARLDPVINADRDKLVKKPAPPQSAGPGSGARPGALPPGLPPGMVIPGQPSDGPG